ncbi:MAG: diversity-generating retroelement protein Avd [Anaerolineae bacterium]|nr:diversity-generating retroelement protein Avd [Anaerolineales bacterium]MCQ3977217.1 diversity-generating retroelement protein Avd [Anaerolineae bacterium]
MASEMVIFTRTYDFISWLIPRLESFPRSQRFGVTRRLQDAALDFYETITVANNSRGEERRQLLRRADSHLDKVRFYLRLAVQWAWLNEGQYQHAAQMVAEIGRLLGGWRKNPDGSDRAEGSPRAFGSA